MVKEIQRDKNDIYGKPILGFFFKNQKFITTFKIILTAVFFYALYFGFVHQSKENTFTTALFWGIFWSFFMVLTLPTFGRIFCGICPHGFMGKYITKFGLKKKMPKWMQNRYIGIFLLVIGWWGVYYMFPGIYKTPFGTAMMFSVMTIVSFIVYFVYRDMSYCKYICPIGTLTRAYAKLSFTWLGTYKSACSECKTFDCATACPYNLKPFTFDKRNSMTDCTLCMECSTACEAVSFKFTKPSETLFKKFQVLPAEIWTFVLILGSIPIAMAFHHGIGRSNAANDMIWAKTAHFFESFINFGSIDTIGLFAFLYALVFSVMAATIGMFIAAKILNKDFKKIFYDLGYSYAPLFILGSLAHTLESFFTRGYDRIVEGFALGFGFGVIDIIPLAKHGDSWLMVFGILKWIAILWALLILYKRINLLKVSKSKKIFAYPFAASLIIFFLSVNVYRAYIIDTYGRAKTGHSMHTQKPLHTDINKKLHSDYKSMH
ncbi:4Fe-4S binding protein [Sulfurimonas sp.]